jgi:hypothetical protein
LFIPRTQKWLFIGKAKNGDEFKFTEKAFEGLKRKYPYREKAASE